MRDTLILAGLILFGFGSLCALGLVGMAIARAARRHRRAVRDRADLYPHW